MPNSYENLYNNTAERYVLGSILIDNTVMNGVSGKLLEEDFYNEDNRKVYRAMANLFKQDSPINILIVLEELKRMEDNIFNICGVLPLYFEIINFN